MTRLEELLTTLPHSISLAIRRGIRQLAAHPSTNEVTEIKCGKGKDSLEVQVLLRLGLPNQWMADGQSPNGVWAVEPVTFRFLKSYPIHAPEVYLRANFDRTLAHIQPGIDKHHVLPCLYEGDLDELMQEQGLDTIVDQTIVWLENAALGQLINPAQGWEPMRRDHLDGFVIADSAYFRTCIVQRQRHLVFGFRYVRFQSSQSRKLNREQDWFYGHIENKIIAKIIPEQHFAESQMEKLQATGVSLALVVAPDLAGSGEFQIGDRYFPDDVTTLGELKERARLWGCSKNLDSALSTLRYRLQGVRTTGSFPIALILGIRRPFPLIGEASNLELILYVFEIDDDQANWSKRPIIPVAHREAITPALLQQFSTDQPTPAPLKIGLVGCGSLGSKIGVHLARSGYAPIALIDKDWLSPHNAARHALLPNLADSRLHWVGAKSKELALVIAALGQQTTVFEEDVTHIAHSPKLREKVFPKDADIIINATASLTVRETLAAIPFQHLSARVAETILFANGDVGLMTLEGAKRNPNSADLIAEVYEVSRQNPSLRQQLLTNGPSLQHRRTGQGCSSKTMVITDAKISMMAAAMSQEFLRLHSEGLHESNGSILLGEVTDSGMGLHWQRFKVPPVQIVSIESYEGWTVRVSNRAHQKIVTDFAAHPSVETGGILMGRIFEGQQTFIVTDVLPAPVDSQRSPAQFTLGTEGVTEMLQSYATSCQQILYCLGTWHSHLGSIAPSKQDWQTLKDLSVSRSIPFVLLIYTPFEYRAITNLQ